MSSDDHDPKLQGDVGAGRASDASGADQADAPSDDASAGRPRLEFELANDRNDRILAWLVVAFAVLLGVFKIADSDIWWHLRAGGVITELGAVPDKDVMSITPAGEQAKSWINMTWLFDLGVYHIHRWAGAAGLIAVKALLVGVTALCLLQLRAAGPTLWWAAVCTGLALIPMSVRFRVRPEVLTTLLVALELVLLERHRRKGGSRLIWLLPVIQVFWVNVHGLFVLGIVLPGLYLVGELVERPWHKDEKPGRVRSLAIAVGLSVLACLVNPFTWRGALFPRELFTRITSPGYTGQIAELQPLYRISPFENPNLWVFYGLVAAALVALLLNRRQLRLSHVLVLAGFLAIGLLSYRNIALATLVAAGLASLNASAWWVGRFGVEPRRGLCWVLYGQIGRGVTAVALLAVALLGVSGRLVVSSLGYERFGVGEASNRSISRGAQFLRSSGLQGNAFAMNLELANQLLWYYWPHKSFMDGRLEVHDEHLRVYENVRKAVRDNVVTDGDVKVTRPDGKVETERRVGWQAMFNKYDIACVVVPMHRPPSRPMYVTFKTLYRASDHWALVYLDAVCAIFARTDLPQNRAHVARLRIDLDRADYAAADPPVKPHEEARARTFWHRLWRTRWPDPEGLIVARHYLVLSQAPPAGLGVSVDFLVIRSLRRALADAPSSATSYALLAKRYEALAVAEAQLASGGRGRPRPDAVRLRQVLYCLNQALACDPGSEQARCRLHLYLAQSYLMVGYLDLAETHFRQARESSVLARVLPQASGRAKLGETATNLRLRIAELKQQVEPMQQQAGGGGALVGAYEARGLMGEAIGVLERARQASMSFNMAMACQLVDLYLAVGRVAEARDMLLRMARSTDARQAAALDLDARFAPVHLMMGDYEQAADRYARLCLGVAMRTVRQYGNALDSLLRGALLDGIAVPTQMTGSLDRLAEYHYRIGLICLEQGRPKAAAEALRKVLDISPGYANRAVVASYLRRLDGGAPATAPSTTRPSTTRPSTTRPSARRGGTTTAPAGPSR